jgi:hypothetical protein
LCLRTHAYRQWHWLTPRLTCVHVLTAHHAPPPPPPPPSPVHARAQDCDVARLDHGPSRRVGGGARAWERPHGAASAPIDLGRGGGDGARGACDPWLPSCPRALVPSCPRVIVATPVPPPPPPPPPPPFSAHCCAGAVLARVRCRRVCGLLVSVWVQLPRRGRRRHRRRARRGESSAAGRRARPTPRRRRGPTCVRSRSRLRCHG